jgi:hypothetical protein
MTDWYQTDSGRRVGFTARPVVGGLLLRPLYDPAVWKKYAGRDKAAAVKWAPLPVPPKVTPVIPAADTEPAVWRHTTKRPAADWIKPGFDDSSWKSGKSGFGTASTPGAVIGTTWDTADVWLRREIDLPDRKYSDLQLWVHHDEDAEVYVNGVLALSVPGYIGAYESLPMTSAGRDALKRGKNTIAVHCHQTTGGQYIDVGIVELGEGK